MKRYFIFAVGLAFAFAGTASAASFTNIEFPNGDVTHQGVGKSSVNATFRVVVPANEVVERIQTDVLGDNLAPKCVEVGGPLGLQEGTHEVSLPILLPPNTGTYTVSVQGSGIFGAFSTVDCTSNVVGSNNFGAALKVVANSSNVGNTNDDEEQGGLFAMLMALIEDLRKDLRKEIEDLIKPAPAPAPAPAPTKPVYCTELQQYVTTDAFSSSWEVSGLQGVLVRSGFMTQAQVNTGPGIYGPKTTLAHTQAMGHCR